MLYTIISLLVSTRSVASWPALQNSTPALPLWAADHGHNELYRPTPDHIIPMKKALEFDAKQHYYEPHHNDGKNGTYKCASCPALNNLAYRGFIPRTGRSVTYQNMAQSMRDVFNFGDDNVLSRQYIYVVYPLTELIDNDSHCTGFSASTWCCHS